MYCHAYKGNGTLDFADAQEETNTDKQTKSIDDSLLNLSIQRSFTFRHPSETSNSSPHPCMLLLAVKHTGSLQSKRDLKLTSSNNITCALFFPFKEREWSRFLS